MLQNINSHHTALTDGDMAEYCFDQEGPFPQLNDEDYQVQVDPPAVELSTPVPQLPDPHQNDGHCGQLLYVQCLELLKPLVEPLND